MPAYSIMKLTWCKDFINYAIYPIMKLTWRKDLINYATYPIMKLTWCKDLSTREKSQVSKFPKNILTWTKMN